MSKPESSSVLTAVCPSRRAWGWGGVGSPAGQGGRPFPARPGTPGRVPETASPLLALRLHGNGRHSQARSPLGYSGGRLSNFSHVRKSPSCGEFEYLLSKLPFPGLLKKGGKRQHGLSFPFFCPCPWESSKRLLSSCRVLLRLLGGSVGSGLGAAVQSVGVRLHPPARNSLAGVHRRPCFPEGRAMLNQVK